MLTSGRDTHVNENKRKSVGSGLVSHWKGGGSLNRKWACHSPEGSWEVSLTVHRVAHPREPYCVSRGEKNVSNSLFKKKKKKPTNITRSALCTVGPQATGRRPCPKPPMSPAASGGSPCRHMCTVPGHTVGCHSCSKSSQSSLVRP